MVVLLGKKGTMEEEDKSILLISDDDDDCIVADEEKTVVSKEKKRPPPPIHPFFLGGKRKKNESSQPPTTPPVSTTVLLHDEETKIIVNESSSNSNVLNSTNNTQKMIEAVKGKPMHSFFSKKPKKTAVLDLTVEEEIERETDQTARLNPFGHFPKLPMFPSISHVKTGQSSSNFSEFHSSIQFPGKRKEAVVLDEELGFKYKRLPSWTQGSSYEICDDLDSSSRGLIETDNLRVARDALKRWLTPWRTNSQKKHHRRVGYVRVLGTELLTDCPRREKNVDDLSDFIDYDEDDNRRRKSNTDDDAEQPILLITGPSSSGKSALIQEVAKEMQFNLLEINSTSCRSGKLLMSHFGESMGNDHHQSAMSLKSKFTKQKPIVIGEKSKQKLDSVGKASQAIYLVEEVDVIYEQDVDFWTAMNQLIRQSKHPIIMTSNCSPEELSNVPSCSLSPFKTSHIVLDPPSTRDLVHSLSERSLNSSAIFNLIFEFGNDIRKLENCIPFVQSHIVKADDLNSLDLVTRLCTLEVRGVSRNHVNFLDPFDLATPTDEDDLSECVKQLETISFVDSKLLDPSSAANFDFDETLTAAESNSGYSFPNYQALSSKSFDGVVAPMAHLLLQRQIADCCLYLNGTHSVKHSSTSMSSENTELEQIIQERASYIELLSDTVLSQLQSERLGHAFNELNQLNRVLDRLFMADFMEMVDAHERQSYMRRRDLRRQAASSNANFEKALPACMKTTSEILKEAVAQLLKNGRISAYHG